MISDEDARRVYAELLLELRQVSALELIAQIEGVIATGRVRAEGTVGKQERLPPAASLGIALRMLMAWAEPAVLASSAVAALAEATGVEVGELRWSPDQQVEVQTRETTTASVDGTPADGHGGVALPSLNSSDLKLLQRQLENLDALLDGILSTGSGDAGDDAR